MRPLSLRCCAIERDLPGAGTFTYRGSPIVTPA
jgi:hypothetical protein